MMDTSFLAGNAPQPLLNPLDIQAKKVAIQNALAYGALQQQEQQKNALAIDATRRQMADQQALRDAMTSMYGANPAPVATATPIQTAAPAEPQSSLQQMGADLGTSLANSPYAAPLAAPAAPAAAPPAGGAPVPPRPAVPTMQDLLSRKVAPADAAGLIAHFQSIDKTAADIDKTKREALAKQQEVNAAIQQHAADMANGILRATPAGQPINRDLLAWHLQNFASLGSQEALQAASVGQRLGTLSPADQRTFLETLAGTPKTLEANAAAQTAQEKVDRFNREAPGIDAENVTKQLTAQGKAPIQPAERERLRLEGIARNQEQQNIALRVKLFNQQYGDPAEGAAPAEITTAQSRAAGDLPLPSPRMKGYDREIALAVAQDPTFATYAGTRFDTKKNFKEKGDANEVVQLATALEHLERAKTNSASMGFEPTLGTNMFPTQHRYHQDIYNLTDEVGRLIKAGVVPEQESKRAIDNLMSAFQGNRDAGLDELKTLMGGKVAAKIQKYVAGTGQLVPASMFDAPTQERLKAAGFGNGIDWNAQAKPSPATPAAAPPAAHDVPAIGGSFNGEKVVSVQRVQ